MEGDSQLQKLIQQMDAKVQGDFQQREQEITVMRERSFHMIGSTNDQTYRKRLSDYLADNILPFMEKVLSLRIQIRKLTNETNLIKTIQLLL